MSERIELELQREFREFVQNNTEIKFVQRVGGIQLEKNGFGNQDRINPTSFVPLPENEYLVRGYCDIYFPSPNGLYSAGQSNFEASIIATINVSGNEEIPIEVHIIELINNQIRLQ